MPPNASKCSLLPFFCQSQTPLLTIYNFRRARAGKYTGLRKKPHPGTAGDMLTLPSIPDISQIMECPICMAVPLPPIYACPTGHIICGACNSQVKKCSLCKTFGVPDLDSSELSSQLSLHHIFSAGMKDVRKSFVVIKWRYI